jgi:tRNA pseudouridine38-40 synthase
MTVCYDGSKFHGWQIQPESPTVEEVLEKALFMLSKEKIKITGSGRTDAGVHALGQVAHFDFPIDMSCNQIVMALNSFVKPYIKVLDIVEVSCDFHARFDAVYRKYKYIITYDKNPFNHHYKTHYPVKVIDPAIFEKCIPYFLGEHDFSSFAKPNPEINNYICHIQEMYLKLNENDIIIHIKANRFLHNMIRRMVGAMVAVSHNNLEPAIIKTWIDEKRHEQKNYMTALPNGLYLVEVGY